MDTNPFTYPKLEITYNQDSTNPYIPTSVSAVGRNAFVELTWNISPAQTDLDRVLIYRSTDPNFTPDDSNHIGDVLYTLPFQTVGGVIPSSYFDGDGIVNGVTYYYKLRSEDKSSNYSSLTTAVSVTPLVSAAYSYALLKYTDTTNNKAYQSTNFFGSPGTFTNPPSGGETEYTAQQYGAVALKDAPNHSSSTDPNEDFTKCMVGQNVQHFKFLLPMDTTTIKNFFPQIRAFPEALSTTTLRIGKSTSAVTTLASMFYYPSSQTDADKFRELNSNTSTLISTYIKAESGSNYVNTYLYTDAATNEHIDYARLGVRYINPNMRWSFKITVSMPDYMSSGSSVIGVAPDAVDGQDTNEVSCPPLMNSNIKLVINRTTCWVPQGDYITDITKPYVGNKSFSNWNVMVSTAPSPAKTCRISREPGTGINAPPAGTYTLVDTSQGGSSYNMLTPGYFEFNVSTAGTVKTLRFDCNVQ